MQLLSERARALAPRGAVALLAAVATLSVAGSAAAIQFTPTATARLHTTGSGQPGAEWNTGTTTTGGDISYDSGTQVLTITAALDVLNYYDPSNGSCSTDVGSNCSVNYGPDLDILLTASLQGITVNPLGGGFFEILVSFETTGGAGYDLEVTDPADSDALVLSGDIIAGTFNGSPTTGLQAQVIYNSNTATAVFDTSNSVGFFKITAGSTYASLFGSNLIGINLGTMSEFSPSLTALAAAAIGSGTLGDFTAEINAQIFQDASGSFVPEPSLSSLLLGGVGMLVWLRRRS